MVSAEAIGALAVGVRKNLSNAMKYFCKHNPDHEISREHNSAGDDQQRRAVMARYVVDAGEGKLAVKPELSVEKLDQQKSTGGGFTYRICF